MIEEALNVEDQFTEYGGIKQYFNFIKQNTLFPEHRIPFKRA